MSVGVLLAGETPGTCSAQDTCEPSCVVCGAGRSGRAGALPAPLQTSATAPFHTGLVRKTLAARPGGSSTQLYPKCQEPLRGLSASRRRGPYSIARVPGQDWDLLRPRPPSEARAHPSIFHPSLPHPSIPPPSLPLLYPESTEHWPCSWGRGSEHFNSSQHDWVKELFSRPNHMNTHILQIPFAATSCKFSCHNFPGDHRCRERPSGPSWSQTMPHWVGECGFLHFVQRRKMRTFHCLSLRLSKLSPIV